MNVEPRKLTPEWVAKQNWMHPVRWIPPSAKSLLDFGCNVGELLSCCQELYPEMNLVGVDVNSTALESARRAAPRAKLHALESTNLPFADESFDCVTCIEVLEHLPVASRAQALAEMRRVLRSGGRLVLRVPHAGWFAWLDAANFRFRLPRLYHSLLREGRRDAGYENGSDGVVWHEHFTRDELLALLGTGWKVEASRTGGLLLFPLCDIACWPLYRAKKTTTSLFRLLQSGMNFDIGIDYGVASYDILLVLTKQNSSEARKK